MDNSNIQSYLTPCSIWFTFHDTFISNSIVGVQNWFWEALNKVSKYSHVVLVGSDGYVYESTTELKFKYKIIPYLKHGIKRTPLCVYYDNELKSADRVGLQHSFTELSNYDWVEITKKARELYLGNHWYGFTELFGTLFTIIKWRIYKKIGFHKKAQKLLTKNNPLDIRNAQYCITFIEILLENYIAYCDININNEILTVDHGWYTNAECIKKEWEKKK